MAKSTEVKWQSKKTLKWASIRIGRDTQKKLERLLLAANRKSEGRKVRVDQLLDLAADIIADEHIKTLQEQSLTNEDRKEQMRQFYTETRGPISRLEYTGFTMKREYFEFLEQYEVAKEKRSIQIAV